MPTLKSVRAQIQRLQAEEHRLLQQAMAGSVAKVKKLMASLGVTLEHLGASMHGVKAKESAAKKARAKRAGAGVAKYRDPATGATWSGFGRVPAWIAGADSRDKYLVGGPGAASMKKSSKVAEPTAEKKTPKVTKSTAPKKKGRTPAVRKASAAKKVAQTSPAGVEAKRPPRVPKSAATPMAVADLNAAPQSSK